jgi:DNA-binding MarR family transcriptional regulator
MGETTVNELAKPFDMSGPAISKHLKVLENAGLISRGREAQWRPCRIEPKALKVVDDWLERYRQFWEERLDRLEEYLNTLQAEAALKQKAAADETTKSKSSRKTSRQAKESRNGRKK